VQRERNESRATGPHILDHREVPAKACLDTRVYDFDLVVMTLQLFGQRQQSHGHDVDEGASWRLLLR
jgi:hypothetical protein